VAGRIERLDVRATGEAVAAQQVVAAIYSADLMAAQQDLNVAERQAARLGGAPGDAARQSSDAMVAAARSRLDLLGMSRNEIDRVAKAGKPNRLAIVRSPAAGTVIERLAAEGAWVEAGGPLVRIADLSRVWVQLDAYERDLGRVAVGQKVRFTVEALPGEQFSGDITFIDPTVDRERRTARVRVAVDNADGRLRPGLAVQASIEGVALVQAPLVVPASAPLFTGRRSVVYVEINTSEGPAYEARVGRLGQRLAEGYPVIAGIEEGQRVVVHGAFVIDADLQLRGGESMMALADDREVDPATEPIPVKTDERKAFAPVIEAYLALQRALAADDLGLATTAARALADTASSLRFGENPLLHSAWTPLGERIATEAARVAAATSLESARGPFEPISHAIERVLVRVGNPLDRPVAVAFCPMARDGSGARWVQSEGDIDNAYYGAVMRKCGEIRALVPAEGLLLPQGGEGKSP
jgi:Cu(I)/Ag(I) efflux system membrane fusion protein